MGCISLRSHVFVFSVLIENSVLCVLMITALIRTHKGREELFQRAVESCEIQGVNVIDYYDYLGPRPDFSYNLICNILKDQVQEGYFFFLDSDDFIIPGAIEELLPHLEPDKAIIVKMLRNGRPKPMINRIERGRIGLPCLVLHSKHKHLAEVTAVVQGDYEWIKAVSEKLPVKYVNVVLVNAGKRSHGK